MTRSNRFQLLDALWASINRIIAIAGKEFVALLKDKGSRLILVVPVIVQAVLFGYGATFNLERVPWTYYDASHSSSSMEVVRRITGTGIFELKAAPHSLGEFEETIMPHALHAGAGGGRSSLCRRQRLDSPDAYGASL